jgi:hypothetical protein
MQSRILKENHKTMWKGSTVFYFKLSHGRAIAEAVSRWLPTATPRVRARVWQVGFVVDKLVSGQVFSEYFGFSCQNRSFHRFLHHHNHPYKRKIEVSPIGEGPLVTPFKEQRALEPSNYLKIDR